MTDNELKELLLSKYNKDNDRLENINYRDDARWTVYIHIVPKEISEYKYDKYYVGITSRKVQIRWNSGRGYSGNNEFYADINKIGWENINHFIFAENLTKQEAFDIEKMLINKLDCMNSNFGYNHSKGGQGSPGYHMSEEYKKNRSIKYSGESNPFFNKNHDEETINLMVAVHYNSFGKNNPVSKQIHQFDINYNYLRSFECINAANRAVGLKGESAIRYAIKKHRPSRGYLWGYDDNIIMIDDIPTLNYKIKESHGNSGSFKQVKTETIINGKEAPQRSNNDKGFFFVKESLGDEMNHDKFKNEIANYVQKYAPQFGIKVCSPIIAQAILESGWGSTNKAKYHNYFGMKFREGRLTCHSGTFIDGSQEQLNNGQYIPITDQWYKFDSMDKGVLGYFQFINTKNYSNLKGVTDPRTYLENIKKDGYATSLKYVDNLMKVINSNNLTVFDNLENTTIQKNDDELNINYRYPCHISNHGDKRNIGDIKYIVIHYTGNKNDTAINNAKYFNSTKNIKASAHYFVDDNNIYQSVSDDIIAWAVGGNYGGGKYYGKCTNSNSISIELCSTNSNITSLTQNNAIRLIHFLMKKYNIKIENVIRHKDVNGKNCPGWTLNTDESFKLFKLNIDSNEEQPVTPKQDKIPLYRVTATALNYRQGPGINYPIVGVIKKNEVYGITKIENNFGLLKSGAGYVSMNYMQKI